MDAEEAASVTDPFIFHPLDLFAKQFICNRRLSIVTKDATIPEKINKILPLGQPCKCMPVTRDENCFFRAISQVISGTEENHKVIRGALVKYAQETGIGTVTGVLATVAEIEALADILATTIYIHNQGRWLRTRHRGVWRGGIYLNNEGCHYEPVLCTKIPPYDVCNTCYRVPPTRQEQAEYVVCEFLEEDPVIPDQSPIDFTHALCESSVQQAHVNYQRYLLAGDVDQQCNGQLASWTSLAATWHAFIAYTDEGWWGDVSVSTVSSFMYLASDGDIAITAPLSSDPGVTCSVTVRAFPSMVTHNIVLVGFRFRCEAFTDETFSSPLSCVHRIVSTVTRPVILARPNNLNHSGPLWSTPGGADRKLPNTLFGAPCRETSHCWMQDVLDRPISLIRMIEDMKTLTDSRTWFRVPYGEHTDYVTQDCIVANLRQFGPRAGAVVYNLSRNMPGYLFDIVTGGRTWFVTFSQHLGYVLTTNDETNNMFFRAMDSLMSYFDRFQRISFVSEAELID